MSEENPCAGAGLQQLVTILWQKTNGVERLLGLDGPTPFCPQIPEPGLVGKVELICRRWAAILSLLKDSPDDKWSDHASDGSFE